MKQYIDLLKYIKKNGDIKDDRTGTGTISVFGYQNRYNLENGFPLLTTKKMATKAIFAELLWFLEGSTDERRLVEIQHSGKREDLIDKKTIWTANANNQAVALGYENNDLVKELGPIYGHNWRKYGLSQADIGIDQISDIIEEIKNNPNSRRLIVNAWDPLTVKKATLPPCHTMFQFMVIPKNETQIHYEIQNNFSSHPDYSKMMEQYNNDPENTKFSDYAHLFPGIKTAKLSCQLYQRSADAFLGVPFNIASYALLNHMIAQVTDLDVGEFIHTFGDLHIYKNHIEQVDTQISRAPLNLSELKLNKNIKNIFDFKMSDIKITNYNSHDGIKAPMAI